MTDKMLLSPMVTIIHTTSFTRVYQEIWLQVIARMHCVMGLHASEGLQNNVRVLALT